jgi:hypothetical protein
MSFLNSKPDIAAYASVPKKYLYYIPILARYKLSVHRKVDASTNATISKVHSTKNKGHRYPRGLSPTIVSRKENFQTR